MQNRSTHTFQYLFAVKYHIAFSFAQFPCRNRRVDSADETIAVSVPFFCCEISRICSEMTALCSISMMTDDGLKTIMSLLLLLLLLVVVVVLYWIGWIFECKYTQYSSSLALQVKVGVLCCAKNREIAEKKMYHFYLLSFSAEHASTYQIFYATREHHIRSTSGVLVIVAPSIL